jgi:hypothetical protein
MIEKRAEIRPDETPPECGPPPARADRGDRPASTSKTAMDLDRLAEDPTERLVRKIANR